MDLLQIVTKCPEIETLYIENLHIIREGINSAVADNKLPLHYCYHGLFWNLFYSLRSASKLRVLRYCLFAVIKTTSMLSFLLFFFSRLVFRVPYNSLDKMIRLLVTCPSLVRLGLIMTSNSFRGLIDTYNWKEKDFVNFLVELVKHLPNLVALLVVLPDAPQSHCIAATKTLEKTYRSARPCFCVQITNSLDSNNPPKLPLCHFKMLACNPPPLVGTMPFHLLLQEPKL